MQKRKTKSYPSLIAHGAVIAALYVVMTYLTNMIGLANGPVQVRISEALTILPLFTPAAIPGLFIGCLLSNVLTGAIVWDIVFGSLATLLGALGTYALRHRFFLAPLPPILANALIIPFVLRYAYALEGSVPYFMLTVGIGEIVSCGILGLLLYYSLEKRKLYIFGNKQNRPKTPPQEK